MKETKRYNVVKNSRCSNWITFVHGFSHNNSYFMQQVEYFRDEYNILLINLLGHGDRYRDEGPFNLYNYSLDIVDIMNELGIKNSIYWGTHTGAACGLLLACEAPTLIKSLILEGTPVPGLDIPSINKHFDATQKVYKENGLKKSLDYWFKESGWFRHMHVHSDREIIDKQYKMLLEFKGKQFNYPTPNINYNLLNKIQKIDIPCLLYNGEYDLDDFIAASEHLSNLNENIITKKVQNTGGFPSWENSESVKDIIKMYLDQIDRRS